MECATSTEIASAFMEILDTGIYSGAAIFAAGYLMAVLPSLVNRFCDWLDNREKKAA